MSINHDDMRIIEETLDDRYVLKTDCNDKQERINDKYASVDMKVELIYHDFSIIKKLMWALASASISTLTVLILEFIFK